MAHRHLKQYNIEDSNIALFGSNIEKQVREHAGDKESAWEKVGEETGTEIWRIEKFKVVPWPKERYGTFYSGDSYIVLHTYKQDPDSNELFYNLHFWLGEETTQDEAGTAAYKTVELDDHLHGLPVQYREVQGHESPQFTLYFSHLKTLHGGVSTGFHHVVSPPPLKLHRLYHIKSIVSDSNNNNSNIHGIRYMTRQVKLGAENVRQAIGGVLVLDKGSQIWQFNRKNSAGRERFKAVEFVNGIVEERQTNYQFEPIDEGESGAGTFLEELGIMDDVSIEESSGSSSVSTAVPPTLYRISDASNKALTLTVTVVPSTSLSEFDSSDIYIIDDTANPKEPAVYIWIGRGVDERERRIGVEIAQRYLHGKENTQTMRTSVVKVNEGRESNALLRALNG